MVKNRISYRGGEFPSVNVYTCRGGDLLTRYIEDWAMETSFPSDKKPLFTLLERALPYGKKKGTLICLKVAPVPPRDVLRMWAAAESGCHSYEMSCDPKRSFAERTRLRQEALDIANSLGIPPDVLKYGDLAALRAVQNWKPEKGIGKPKEKVFVVGSLGDGVYFGKDSFGREDVFSLEVNTVGRISADRLIGRIRRLEKNPHIEVEFVPHVPNEW